MRPTQDDVCMSIAQVIAMRGTCPRRKVGCVIVDSKYRVLSTGYNGVPSGAPHCYEMPCAGAFQEHGNTTECEAVHAEQNALLQCVNSDLAHRIYTTSFPCMSCFRMMCNTEIREVIYIEAYTSHEKAVYLLNKKLRRPLTIRRYHATQPIFPGDRLEPAKSIRITKPV